VLKNTFLTIKTRKKPNDFEGHFLKHSFFNTLLEERMRAHEGRIAELGKMLAAKGEENRELLRARIEMSRRQLETTRTRNPLEFNQAASLFSCVRSACSKHCNASS